MNEKYKMNPLKFTYDLYQSNNNLGRDWEIVWAKYMVGYCENKPPLPKIKYEHRTREPDKWFYAIMFEPTDPDLIAEYGAKFWQHHWDFNLAKLIKLKAQYENVIEEICPHCDTVNKIMNPEFKMCECNNCHRPLKPCSLCDMDKVDCNNCTLRKEGK